MTALASDPSVVTTRFRLAMEARDLDGLIATLAPDFVLNSPLTDRVAFHGHGEMRELMRTHFAAVEDVRYFTDLGDSEGRAQFYRAHVNGQPVEVATRLEINDDGLISEITVYLRPLPGLTALAVALVGPIAADRHGPRRAVLARLLLVPLALVTRLGDRLVDWFT
jgi:hypothetical protein